MTGAGGVRVDAAGEGRGEGRGGGGSSSEAKTDSSGSQVTINAGVPAGEYPAYRVVSTIQEKFFPYRGLHAVAMEARNATAAAATGGLRALTRDAVTQEMDNFGYYRLDAARDRPRGERSRVVVLVLGGGKYAHHAPDLRLLIRGVMTEKQVLANRLDELIVVAEDAFFKHRPLLDIIEEYKAESELVAKGPDPTGRAHICNVYNYRCFALAVPEHVEVPRHRIMAPDEVEAFYKFEHLEPSDLISIYSADPPVVWLGARVGDLVEITRMSETAIKAVAVRRVINTPAT